MSEGGADNAMVEVALALAMAFFAIMVLAMVSMGVPPAERVAAGQGIALAPSTASAAGGGAADDRRLVIHYRDRLLDRDLRPLAPAALAGPLTIAIDPALPLGAALDLRRRFADQDVLLSTLDQRWLTRLQEMTHDD